MNLVFSVMAKACSRESEFDILRRMELNPEISSTRHGALKPGVELRLVADPVLEAYFLVLEPAAVKKDIEDFWGELIKISNRQVRVAQVDERHWLIARCKGKFVIMPLKCELARASGACVN